MPEEFKMQSLSECIIAMQELNDYIDEEEDDE